MTLELGVDAFRYPPTDMATSDISGSAQEGAAAIREAVAKG